MKKVYIKTAIKKIGAIFACALVLALSFIIPASADNSGFADSNNNVNAPYVSYGDFIMLFNDVSTPPNREWVNNLILTPPCYLSTVASRVTVHNGSVFRFGPTTEGVTLSPPNGSIPGSRQVYIISESNLPLNEFKIVSTRYLDDVDEAPPYISVPVDWKGSYHVEFDYAPSDGSGVYHYSQTHTVDYNTDGVLVPFYFRQNMYQSDMYLITNFELTATPTTTSTTRLFDIDIRYKINTREQVDAKFNSYDNLIAESYFAQGLQMSEVNWTDWLVYGVGGFLSFELFPGFSFAGVLSVIVVAAVVLVYLKFFAGG